jgi:hypothetical protein
VPKLGRVLLLIGTPLGRMLLVVMPLLLLGLYEIARIWRPRQEESPDAAGA